MDDKLTTEFNLLVSEGLRDFGSQPIDDMRGRTTTFSAQPSTQEGQSFNYKISVDEVARDTWEHTTLRRDSSGSLVFDVEVAHAVTDGEYWVDTKSVIPVDLDSFHIFAASLPKVQS